MPISEERWDEEKDRPEIPESIDGLYPELQLIIPGGTRREESPIPMSRYIHGCWPATCGTNRVG